MCLAIDQAALQSCQGDKPPGRDASDQYQYRPRQGRLYPLLLIVVVVTATPPHRCRDHRDGPGAWSEGGGGYFYFVLFVCLAGGIWLLARSRHINFPTTTVTIVDVLNSYVN